MSWNHFFLFQEQIFIIANILNGENLRESRKWAFIHWRVTDSRMQILEETHARNWGTIKNGKQKRKGERGKTRTKERDTSN